MKLIETLVPADFRSSITGPLRRYFTGTFVSCMGQGLTLSLFVVYLHNVRGFSTDFATLLLSAAALVGIGSSPVWGSLTDRFGPIRVIMVAVIADAASNPEPPWRRCCSRSSAAPAGGRAARCSLESCRPNIASGLSVSTSCW
jgi:MFS family permease